MSYHRHPIPRASGGLRWLHVPSKVLAAVQVELARLLLTMTPSSGSITAFLPRRGPAAHALAHQGARALVSIDIRDFFGSVRPSHLRPWLRAPGRKPFGGGLDGWSDEGVEAILKLLFVATETAHPFLPQGAPSSPAAANLAATPLDAIIRRSAKKLWTIGGFAYTRYADDLVLSLHREDISPLEFLSAAQEILQGALRSSGWALNPSKTRTWISSWGVAPLLCGIQISSSATGSVQIPRTARRRGRAARLHLETDPCIPEAAGTVAWLYAATGHPGWMAWTGNHIGRLALRVVGRLLVPAFRSGWDRSLDDQD